MVLVYAYFCLDIIHAGHILFMKNAKELSGNNGKLIVGILTDKAIEEKKPKPVMSFGERMEIAKAIKYIDIAIPQNTYSPVSNIIGIKPDIVMESTNHNSELLNNVKRAVKSIGGRLIIFPYHPLYSSTIIKERIQKIK